MGRTLRVTPGDAVYHMLNRANGRQALCDKEGQRKRGEATVLAGCADEMWFWNGSMSESYSVMKDNR